MAGSYHNSPGRVGGRYSEAHHGRRCRLDAEADSDIVGCKYLSSRSRKVLRGEPCIIANDKTRVVKLLLFEIFCNSLGADTHIIEGEILGDNPPPPIGAKFDWDSHGGLSERVSLGPPKALRPLQEVYYRIDEQHPDCRTQEVAPRYQVSHRRA